MDILRRLYPPFVGGRGALGLLLVRLVMGLAFILHGYSKIQNPTGWMGPSGPPGFMQALAAISEFGGGFAILLGLLTPLASLGIICTMIGALFLALLPKGAVFVSNSGGASYELPLMFLVVAIAFITLGPGTLSVDALLFGRKSQTGPRGTQ